LFSFVAASINKENIFVLEADKRGTSTVTQYQERIFGLSADQALESPYFGLQSTRASAFLEDVRQITTESRPEDPSAALRLMDKMADDPHFKDVNTNYQVGMPEIHIVPDRKKAAEAGVSMSAIGNTVGALIGGTRIGKYKDKGRRYDVRVRVLRDNSRSCRTFAGLPNVV